MRGTKKKWQTRAGCVPPLDNIKEKVMVEEVKKEKSEKRRERVPFGAHRMKLSFENKAGKVRRWFNDVGGRVADAEAAGYSFVTAGTTKVGDTALGSGNQDLGTRISRRTGTKENGAEMVSYLMEIDEDLYKEDQLEKQKRVDDIDTKIRKGNIEGVVGVDGRYVPSSGIKIN